MLPGHFVTRQVGPNASAWLQETYDAFELDFPSVVDGSCKIGDIPVYRLWNQRVDTNHPLSANKLFFIPQIR